EDGTCGETGVAGAYDNGGEALDGGTSGDLDRDLRRIRDRIEDGGPLLRLSDDCLDLLPGGVRIDVEGHLDVVEAVPDVAVDAEDPADVMAALDGRLDGAELDPAVLRDRRDSGRETACEPDQEILDRRDPHVGRGEDLRVVGVEDGLGPVALLLAQT